MQKENTNFNTLERTVAAILITMIKIYRATLSCFLGKQCKFIPSCSEYAIIAIKLHGPIKGFFMAMWRIMRCNPFSKGGYDYPQ